MASSKDRKKSDGTDTTHNNPSGSQKNSVSSEYDSRDAKKDKYLKQKKKINYYLSKEDINYLVQNTRFSEQELRYLITKKVTKKMYIFLRKKIVKLRRFRTI